MTMATRMVITARAPRPWPMMASVNRSSRSGDTGPVEDGPGQDEHRDGQQRVLGDPGVDIGRDGHDAEFSRAMTRVPARPSEAAMGTPETS